MSQAVSRSHRLWALPHFVLVASLALAPGCEKEKRVSVAPIAKPAAAATTEVEPAEVEQPEEKQPLFADLLAGDSLDEVAAKMQRLCRKDGSDALCKPMKGETMPSFTGFHLDGIYIQVEPTMGKPRTNEGDAAPVLQEVTLSWNAIRTNAGRYQPWDRETTEAAEALMKPLVKRYGPAHPEGGVMVPLELEMLVSWSLPDRDIYIFWQVGRVTVHIKDAMTRETQAEQQRRKENEAKRKAEAESLF